jgi:hypothetical protein
MDITRDLFPTDERSPYLTLTLASRDIASHNLLTRLTSAERDRVGEALTAASSTIVEVLRAAHSRDGTTNERGSFGCGT